MTDSNRWDDKRLFSDYKAMSEVAYCFAYYLFINYQALSIQTARSYYHFFGRVMMHMAS